MRGTQKDTRLLYLWVYSLILPSKSCYSEHSYILVNVESEGPYPPERLFLESVKVMRDKIANIRRAAEVLLSGGADESTSKGVEDVEMSGT